MDKALSPHYSLVVEIQSDMVSGSVVHFSENAEPVIMYHVSARSDHKDQRSSDHITRTMLALVENISAKIIRDGMGRSIGDVHFVLSSPWVVSKAKKVRVEYEEEMVISSDIVESIVEEGRNKVLGESDEDIVLIEQKICDIQLNGYSVDSYVDRKARRLEVSFVLSLSSDEVMKKMRLAVSKHIHFHNDYYHSAFLLHYVSARMSAVDGEEYALVHVHGELTDIVTIRGGFSSDIGSFPFGSSTLLRNISEALPGHGHESVKSLLSMHEEQRMDDEHGRKIDAVVSAIIHRWHEDCMKMRLPDRIRLIAINHPGIFKKILEKKDRKVMVFDGPLIKIYASALNSVMPVI